MGRSTVFVVVGWLAAAALATIIGIGAIRLVGASITGTPGGVRSQDDIERALAVPPPPLVGNTAPEPETTAGSGVGSATQPPRPGPEAATPGARPPASRAPANPPAAASGRRGFSGRGGIALAECVGRDVLLVSWAPAPGYRVIEVDRGPDDDVQVTFQGPGGESELNIRCVGGQPVAFLDGDEDDDEDED